MTRFGIYKRVRQHAAVIEQAPLDLANRDGVTTQHS
jgi:hypothetical protein